MTDNVSKKQRSWIMSRIRSKHTAPELVVRSALHRMGLRFRLHQADLPGRPDLVFRSLHTVVFVHGCFWHRHCDCRFAYTPKTRVRFWKAKLKGNAARDRRTEKELRIRGWRVLTVWECQTKDQPSLALLLGRMFGSLVK